MTEPDLVENFFTELGRRGHDPLLDKDDGTGRFEIVEDGHTDQRLVTIKGGRVTVSRGEGDVDWVMRAERKEFERIIHGDAGALAAFIQGTLSLTFENKSLRFGLLTRLFAGSPESRKQWIPDERWQRAPQ